ncbi:MAG: ABC transporter ATP-binding protein ['Conium maculatum' witches'-broom phytoplasma]|nr:ABC transporter ATP-binding protein ['Conium maculatum' witches'-broom phytoplasma]
MSLLKINNLHTYFETEEGLVKAIRGISFTVEKGKTLGIIGESGSGKSQNALSILQLFDENQKIHQGEIIFDGQIISAYNEKQMQKIRGNEIAMIFQDASASLNPAFNIKDQIKEVLLLHQDISSQEAEQKTKDILEKVKITNVERVMNSFPHQLSGGMNQRVMIAMGLVCQPKILIADEATTALDVLVQQEILKLLMDLQKEFKTTILFITHDLGAVS